MLMDYRQRIERICILLNYNCLISKSFEQPLCIIFAFVVDRIIMLFSDHKTVLVVGGGLSGLTAAREIIKRSPNTKVIVLEAGPEVGGRTRSIKLEGCTFDEGGMFIGKTQIHALQLADESGNQLLRTECKGAKLMEIGGMLSSYQGDIPSIGWLSLLNLQWNTWKIDWMAKKVSIQNPHSTPLAHYWDAITVQAWITANLTSQARILMEAAIRVILGTQLSEVSILFFLNYIKQSQGIENLTKTEGGLQENITRQGTQHMSQFLEQQIRSRGGEVRLNFKVKSITQNKEHCTLQSNEGVVLKGDYIIFAAPPTCANQIDFTPQLSAQKRLINKRAFMGNLAKVILLYKERYWKAQGFTGEFVSDCSDSPVMNCFDGSKPNQKGELQPALVVFIGGAAYRYWREREDFEEAMLKKLAEIYKEEALLKPVAIHWRKWEDETVGGAPVCLLPPGVLSQITDLRKPEGRVHWAGTEMATVSTGFMDGAIQSGKRSAEEVLKRIEGIQVEQAIDESYNQLKPNYLLANGSSVSKWPQWW